MENKDQDTEGSGQSQNGRADYAVDLEDLDGPQPELQPESKGYIGLTGSKFRDQQLTPELPKGVKVVIGLLFLGVVASFLDNSQYSEWFILGNMLVLLLAVGLFARSNVARWLVIGLCGAMVVLAVLGLATFFQATQRFNNAVDHYHQLISGVQHESFTEEQIRQLQSQDRDIQRLQKRVGKTKTLAYFKYGLVIIGYSGIIMYLNRPKVREAFRTASDL